MKLRLFFYALLAGLLFSACSEDAEEAPFGSIAGSVSDKTTGEPVATVNVSLSPGGYSTVTGSDGTFQFMELEPDRYIISISKEGYTPNQSREFEVQQKKQTPAHLLIERIPAVITADRNNLDFGANAGLNTLSFNIVNSSYENLDWSIEENCGWITEVKPSKGTLQYGKTEAIVVVIDRNELEEGDNEAVIVVRSSSNGSSEVKVKAVGAARVLPTLNTLDATDISTSSAILNGKITNVGNPAYTERGFVYHTESKPTLENTLGQLTAPVTEDAKYSCRVEGLSFGEKYYVRAYAKNKNGVIYSSNEISFTAQALLPQVSVQEATDINVSAGTAMLHGSVVNAGDPAYTERGFVYGTVSNPTVEATKVIVSGEGTGAYSTSISDLAIDKTYYVRAYAVSETGIVYSPSEISFTTSSTLPEVSVQEATDINVSAGTAMLHGTVGNVGNPAYTERGFVYGTVSNPTVDATKVIVTGKGMGAYSASIADLVLDKTYYVRAYAVSEVGTVYSSTEISFTTTSTLSEVSVQEATDINVSAGTAMLHGTVINVGDPAYTERGFVYGTVSNPTVEATKIIVSGKGTGAYSTMISDLSHNQTYYVRAYAVNEVGVVYSSVEISFTTETTLPVLSIQSATEVNIGFGTAMLHGTIIYAGNPVYSERGFVYGIVNNPTIEDKKVIASGNGTDAYSALISELSFNQIYYVRAYAICKTGTVYSSEIQVSMLPILPQISIQNATNINLSARSAVLHGNVIDVGNPIYTERGFVYGTISNPTVEDKKVIAMGNGTGAYSASISELSANQIYYVRAYAVCKTGTVYSSTEIQVSMMHRLPQVSVQAATNINISTGAAVLHGTVINAGDPAYTECGFVYGTMNYPTINNTKIIANKKGNGTYDIDAINLPLDQLLYVRTYATCVSGTVYSSEYITISTKAILPKVTTLNASDVDFSAGKAILRGEIVNLGTPEYTERGFVFGTIPDPTINDTKVVADGNGLIGSFSKNTTGLPKENTYYVRAYAINRAGIAYGNSVTIAKPEWSELTINGKHLAIQREDIGMYSHANAVKACQDSRLGGFTDWRLPSIDELNLIYDNYEILGGFSTVSGRDKSYYWSSTWSSNLTATKSPTMPVTGFYYYLYFNNGESLTQKPSSIYSARCVRTIK